MIVDGFQVSHRVLPGNSKFTLIRGQIVQLSRGPANTNLIDLDASQNTDPYTDLGTDDDGGSGTEVVKTYTVTNSANGTMLRLMPKSGVGNSRQKGILVVKKNAEYQFADSAGDVIELSLIHI